MECFLYFFFTHACILEHSPTLGLLHGVFDEIHHAFMAEFIPVSGVGGRSSDPVSLGKKPVAEFRQDAHRLLLLHIAAS